MNSAKSISQIFNSLAEASLERPQSKLERELAPLDMLPAGKFVAPLLGGILKPHAIGLLST